MFCGLSSTISTVDCGRKVSLLELVCVCVPAGDVELSCVMVRLRIAKPLPACVLFYSSKAIFTRLLKCQTCARRGIGELDRSNVDPGLEVVPEAIKHQETPDHFQARA